jgi:hypothetical protein
MMTLQECEINKSNVTQVTTNSGSSSSRRRRSSSAVVFVVVAADADANLHNF